MKRFLTLLLILLLFCGGTSAETVARQINAPETYQAAYYSNTGRTKITVDATVHVPDVESIPTYAVTVRDFTVEDGIRFTALLYPDQTWERWPGERDLPYDEMYESYSGSNNQYESRHWTVSLPSPWLAYASISINYSVGLFTRQPGERRLSYEWTDPETHLFFYPSADFGHMETIGKTLKGQLLTVEEATALADDFMAEMAPEYELRTVFGVEGEKGDAKVYHTLAYCFAYTRSVNAVPVTYTTFKRTSVDFEDIAMAPAPGREYITLVIHNDRIVNFEWHDPYEIGEIIQTQTELLPFAEIMGIFGMIAPLSMQITENDMGGTPKAKNGMRITEIRLGYMPVLCKDNPNQMGTAPRMGFYGQQNSTP